MGDQIEFISHTTLFHSCIDALSLFLKITATDRGTPRRSATGTLVVNIRDVNNQNPFFPRSTYQESVREGI